MPAEKQAESTVGVSEQHESDVALSHPSSRSPNPICCLQDATAAAVVASCTQHSIDTWLVEGAVAVLCMVFSLFSHKYTDSDRQVPIPDPGLAIHPDPEALT